MGWLFGGVLVGGFLWLLGGSDAAPSPDPGPSPDPTPEPDPTPGPDPQPPPPDSLPSVDDLVKVLCASYKTQPSQTTDALLATSLDTIGIVGPWPPSPNQADWQWALWTDARPVADQVRTGVISCVPDDEEIDFVPAANKCKRNGLAYNAILFPNPPSIVTVLRGLGFGKTTANRPAAPIPASNTNPLSTEWQSEIKRFQSIARGLNLPGLVNATADDIDGYAGPCTLVAMGDAEKHRLAGTWPYVLV